MDYFDAADTPVKYVREYLRGFADVAGNVRPANRYVDGKNRVRLDILNYPTNWRLPVQLCHLLQERLEVPVQHSRINQQQSLHGNRAGRMQNHPDYNRPSFSSDWLQSYRETALVISGVATWCTPQLE